MDDIKKFLQEVEGIDNIEQVGSNHNGLVIQYNSGHRTEVSYAWYLNKLTGYILAKF